MKCLKCKLITFWAQFWVLSVKSLLARLGKFAKFILKETKRRQVNSLKGIEPGPLNLTISLSSRDTWLFFFVFFSKQHRIITSLWLRAFDKFDPYFSLINSKVQWEFNFRHGTITISHQCQFDNSSTNFVQIFAPSPSRICIPKLTKIGPHRTVCISTHLMPLVKSRPWRVATSFLGGAPVAPLKVSERGYDPETPSNFPHHSSVMLNGWHTHLSCDWWRLPSGEAALASPLWQAPSNSSLDWASVGVTLGPDSELGVWGLGHLVLGENTRTRLMTSVS